MTEAAATHPLATQRSLMRRVVLGGALAGAALLADPAAPCAQPRVQPLRGPVDVEARRRLRGRPAPASGCAPAPTPVRDLSVEGAYTDPAFSKVDPERLKRQAEQSRDVGQFTWKVAQLSDSWLQSRPAQPQAAQCALTWLDGWAQAGALLGKLDTPDSQHHRKWTLAGLSLALLKIRSAPGLDQAALTRVVAWFGQLADASEAYYTHWPPGGHNNHIQWLGLAMAGTAVAANDPARLARAYAIYDEAAQSITPEGVLPIELGRKGRAFNYHIFSLVPLVMIAEIAQANGHDLYVTCDGALHRLAARVQAGLTDQGWFAQAAGTPQEWTGVTPYSVCWGEPYFARFPNAGLGQLIAPRRPIFYHWLGGNVTDSYGSPALPFPGS